MYFFWCRYLYIGHIYPAQSIKTKSRKWNKDLIKWNWPSWGIGGIWNKMIQRRDEKGIRPLKEIKVLGWGKEIHHR